MVARQAQEVVPEAVGRRAGPDDALLLLGSCQALVVRRLLPNDELCELCELCERGLPFPGEQARGAVHVEVLGNLLRLVERPSR